MAGLRHTESSVDLLADPNSDPSPTSHSQSKSRDVHSNSPTPSKSPRTRGRTRADASTSTSTSSQSKEESMEDELPPTPSQSKNDTDVNAQGEEAAAGDQVDVDPVSGGNEDVVMSNGQDGDVEENNNDGHGGVASAEAEAGPSNEGKRVKVYELRDSSWFDRGTGFCKGVYDETQDIALLIVEAEEVNADGGKPEAPGGFLKDELLLNARVEREDIYGKQQDTLIVWTEPSTGLDIALSFQDAEGCDDIWQFINEVQRHLQTISNDADQQAPSSSSPVTASPMLGVAPSQSLNDSRISWQPPNLGNLKDQELWLRMQSKSPVARERAVEHIINEDYIKQLIGVLEQAEDLESVEDLHSLCSLMQTVLLFNDNGIFEYILQDDIFMGVIGILEWDPEFPGFKAAYRAFFQDVARFREVVEIKDENIRNKIHQTYRLLYLKDVVLARVLDDPTFNILNGFVFFNQVDIITYIQQNDSLLTELFEGFRNLDPDTSVTAVEPLDERKRDVLSFLHQLMLMGKGIQLPNRLALYRNLIERGLLFVCEWAFRRHESPLLHAGAEILTLAVEHDANAVRLHVFKEEEAKRRTLIMEIIGLLQSTKNLGLMSQMADTLKTLLETPPENDSFIQRKEGPISETFSTHFYESCANQLFKPLLDAPDIKGEAAKGKPVKLPREKATLFQNLVELLSFCVINHQHRASYFILSNPISKKVVGLLYVKDKPLRHAALRFVRACLKTPNHFIHRYYVKNDLLLPLLELLEEESTRDNMLSSSCMEVLDLIRKDNLKAIINYLFDNYRERIEKLGARPFLKAFVAGLTSRWEMNNEPPPAPPPIEAESSSSKAWSRAAAAEAEEEDYFNASDDEDELIGPKPPTTTVTAVTTDKIPLKRKRVLTHGGGPKKRERASRPGTAGAGGGGALGLDYDDGSDSDSSGGGASPRHPSASTISTGSHSHVDNGLSSSSTSASPKKEVSETDIDVDLEEDLGDVAMRMRAKRQREEEEEEGFAGLLVGATTNSSGKTTTPTSTSTPTSVGEGVKIEEKEKEREKKGGGTPVKSDLGKKIRLNFGLGKKLSGAGSGAGAGAGGNK